MADTIADQNRQLSEMTALVQTCEKDAQEARSLLGDAEKRESH
jgi:hypothetical protein